MKAGRSPKCACRAVSATAVPVPAHHHHHRRHRHRLYAHRHRALFDALLLCPPAVDASGCVCAAPLPVCTCCTLPPWLSCLQLRVLRRVLAKVRQRQRVEVLHRPVRLPAHDRAGVWKGSVSPQGKTPAVCPVCKACWCVFINRPRLYINAHCACACACAAMPRADLQCAARRTRRRGVCRFATSRCALWLRPPPPLPLLGPRFSACTAACRRRWRRWTRPGRWTVCRRCPTRAPCATWCGPTLTSGPGGAFPPAVPASPLVRTSRSSTTTPTAWTSFPARTSWSWRYGAAGRGAWPKAGGRGERRERALARGGAGRGEGSGEKEAGRREQRIGAGRSVGSKVRAGQAGCGMLVVGCVWVARCPIVPLPPTHTTHTSLFLLLLLLLLLPAPACGVWGWLCGCCTLCRATNGRTATAWLLSLAHPTTATGAETWRR
jgi:hypothetical protein